MILVLSLVLGLLSFAGVVWIFVGGMIVLSPFSVTVDGLFMTLILLTLSACFLLNAYWEMRDRGLIGKKKAERQPRPQPHQNQQPRRLLPLRRRIHNGNPGNNFAAPWEGPHPRA